MKAKVQFFAALAFLALGISASGQAESSSMQISSRLYHGEREVSGERGTVREFTAWRNCLYVSFAELDGDFFLDVWNIEDPRSPRFVEEHAKGNMHSDQGALVPDAHLQAPRDMHVIDSHLIYWRDKRAEVFQLNADCTLADQDHGFAFPDAFGEGMGRLSYAGQMAATEMYDENARSAYRLINLQDPTKPFLQAAGELETELSGTFNAQPSTLELDRGTRTLELTSYTQSRSSHISGFWSETILAELFNLANSNLTLRGVAANVLSEQLLRSQQQRIVDILSAGNLHRVAAAQSSGLNKKALKRLRRLRRRLARAQKRLARLPEKAKGKQKKLARKITRLEKQISRITGSKNESGEPISGDEQDDPNAIPTPPAASTLRALIEERFAGEQELIAVLSELSIEPEDNVKMALQKAIEHHLSNALEETVRQNLLVDLLPLLEDEVFALPNLPLAELKGRLEGLLNQELTQDGVVDYLLNKLFSPLLGNPAFMEASLGDLLQGLTNNQASSAIDASLSTAQSLMPSQIILEALGFELPACLRVPGSAREFLEIILIHAGPELNEDGPAFWEIMKAVQFYFGNTDFARYERELESALEQLHGTLASEIIGQAVGFIEQVEDLTKTPAAVFQELGADFSARKLISELLVEVVLERLERRFGAGVSSQSIEAFLGAQELELSPRGLGASAEPATLGDLIEWLEVQGLASLSKEQILGEVSALELSTLRAHLERPLHFALRELFGQISLDAQFSDAVHHFILGRLDPSVFGDFVQETLGSILSRMELGDSFTGVLGTAGLAVQGDCISQWIVAIDTASAVAAGSVVFSAKAAVLEAASLAVDLAYDLALKYTLRFAFEQIASELFDGFSGDYRSWYAKLEQTRQQINLQDLGVPATRLYNVTMAQEHVAVLSREVGFLGALPGEDTTVQISIFNPKKLNQGARHINLGNWQMVNGVQTHDDYMLINGRQISEGRRPRISAMLVKIGNDRAETYEFFGSDAVLFSAAPQFRPVRNGESFAINSAAGGIVLFETR